MDVNGNWLLDWAENDSGNGLINNMRSGLHSPGVQGGKNREIANVQIVRFPTKYRFLPVITGYPSLEDETYGLDNIVNGDTMLDGSCFCDAYSDQLELWARRLPDATQQNEIVITLRNQSEVDKKKDEIPFGADRISRLTDLRKYSYRFAKCVDFMQFGNESFQGAGEFLINGVPISTLSGQAFVDAVAQVDDWITDQLETARIASALGGRPLRFIGPGVPGGIVVAGYLGDPQFDPPCEQGCLQNNADRSAYTIQETNKLMNEEHMYFDLHLHYKTVEWALGGSGMPIGVIDMVVDTGAPG